MTDNNQDRTKQIKKHITKGGRFYGKKTEHVQGNLAPGTDKALQPYFDMMARVCNQWALFEMTLDQTIWGLVDATPSYAACLTSNMGSSHQKLKAANALLTIWPDTQELVKRVNKLSGGLEKVVRKRNRVIHDPIGYDPENQLVLAYRSIADKKEDFGWGIADIHEYRNTNAEIKKLLDNFSTLSNDILSHVSSQKKPMPLHFDRP